MFDKEIEAIAKCTEVVKELDEDAKVRVIKYLIERFGIGTNSVMYNQSNSNQREHQPPDPQLLSNASDQFVDFAETGNEDYPSLKDLLIKNYRKTETEWILCYAFFSSKFGTDKFKREDILEKYKENNRLTQSTQANLANNLNSCIRKDWLKSINSSEFILKTEGVDYAKEVLKGKSTSKEVKAAKRKINNSTEPKAEE